MTEEESVTEAKCLRWVLKDDEEFSKGQRAFQAEQRYTDLSHTSLYHTPLSGRTEGIYHAQSLSHIWLCNSSHPGIKPASLVSPAFPGGFCTTEPPGKPKAIYTWPQTQPTSHTSALLLNPPTLGDT